MAESYLGKTYETINAWVEDGIGYMQFNRPKAMNAVNFKLLDESIGVLESYKYDPEVRVIIICGDERSFAAGADLRDWHNLNVFEARDGNDKVHATINAVEDNHKPVIAAVRGLALGGGLELVLACDIRIIAEDAVLGLPEINLGIFPGGGGTQRFPRCSAINIVKQYVYTGDFFDAQTAYRIGLANMVVPADQVMDEARKLARRIAKKSPLALREAKNAINMSMNMDIKSGLRAEQIAWAGLFSSQDQKEGMKAFLENRKAVFQGK